MCTSFTVSPGYHQEGPSPLMLTSVKAAHSSPSGPVSPKTRLRKVESRLMAGLVGLRRRPSGMLPGQEIIHFNYFIDRSCLFEPCQVSVLVFMSTAMACMQYHPDERSLVG